VRAELLHELATKLKAEIESTDIVTLLTELDQSLQNQINSPSEATQEAVSTVKQKIIIALNAAPSNSFSPAWQKLLLQAKIKTLFGKAFLALVQKALTTVGVTPSEAQKDIRKLLTNQKQLTTRTAEVLAGLEYYEVRSDILKPGEFEVMIEIPGSAIGDELKQFGREALDINNILLVFEEISTGTREPIKIRALASSDPTIFLHSPYAAALLIATSIERLAKFYSQMQGIIKNHRELKAVDAPATVLDGIRDFFDQKIKEAVDTIASEILEKRSATVEPGRLPELAIELRHSLYELARRLDEGYGFDVRGEPPKKAEEGESEPTDAAEQRAAAKLIADVRPRLQSFVASDEPILGLPKPKDDIAPPAG
jgi:hypothetical protein